MCDKELNHSLYENINANNTATGWRLLFDNDEFLIHSDENVVSSAQ